MSTRKFSYLTVGAVIFFLLWLGCEEMPTQDKQTVSLNLAPVVHITQPQNNSSFRNDETIQFEAKVTDIKDKNHQLKAVWVSNKDGVLDTARVNENGITTFTSDNLSYNTHTIYLRVTDSNGNVGKDSVQVLLNYPEPVAMQSVTVENNAVVVKWNKSNLHDFSKYIVYRSITPDPSNTLQKMATITYQGTTSYSESPPPICQQAFYYVEVFNNAGHSARSEGLSIDEPAGDFYRFYIKQALIHPTDTKIFIIDAAQQHLYKIDYYNLTIPEEYLYIPGEFGYGDLEYNGSNYELYVPLGNIIKIFSLDPFQETGSITVPYKIHSVEADQLGHLYVSLEKTYPVDSTLLVYDRASGQQIGGPYTGSGGRLLRSPSDPNLLELKESDQTLHLHGFNNQGEIVNHLFLQPMVPLSEKLFAIVGRFLITGEQGHFFSSNTLDYFGMVGSGEGYSDFYYAPSFNHIYASRQSGKVIQRFSYTSLNQLDNLETHWNVERMFVKGSQLVTIETSIYGSHAYKTGIY
ncbi:MAG: hypothetical protein WAN36_01050 [Calditrichia bacterium]